MKKRFKLIIAVYLLLIKNNKILLSRRFNTGFEDGNYSLPAGHLDGNESAIYALIREASEEVGIIIQPKNIRLVHIMHRYTGDINNERMSMFFLANHWKGKPKIMETNKCDDLRWFPLNKLPQNTVTYVKNAIGNYSKNIIYSESGWGN